MTISIVNHKGGTGKTTTTINLGSALASEGQRVLVIDFDAQGSLSYSLGIGEEEPTIAEALLHEIPVQQIVLQREGMDVLPANSTLADVELAIAKSGDRFNHLVGLLSALPSYDFVLIDCPPSLSLLTLNALAASDSVIVPMQMDVLALRGLDSMQETIQKISTINPKLEILGVLPIMVDPRKNIFQEILLHLRTHYSVRLFKQVIHTSVRAAEAPSFGKSVLAYAPSSSTAADYRQLAKEIMELSREIQQQLYINT
jgi:chromosome partitioning protein